MRIRVLIAIATIVVITVAARWGRGYPWELAILSGVLIGGLAFATLQTLTRLRITLRQFGPKN